MTQHHSFALATVVNDMVTENNVILDLGSMASGSTGAFLKMGCKCYVEDLNEFLEEVDTSSENSKAQLDAHLLDKPSGLKFDFVLCWDILNYLDADLLEHLMQTLSPHFKEGTILHTMRYVGESMPASPGHFKIGNNFNLELIEASDSQKVPVSSLSTVKMLKHMGAFTMRKTLMNQQGMKHDINEMLLEYGNTALGKNLKRNTQSNQLRYSSHKTTFDDVFLPCLAQVLDHVSPKANLSILETSKKSGRAMEHLNTIASNVYVEDVYSSMMWHDKIAANGHSTVNDNMLRFSKDIYFDVVLLWDLVNFTDFHKLQRLMELLKRNLNPGALIHILLFKNEGAPDSPAVFEVNNDTSVTVKGEVKGNNQRPVSTTAELMKLMSHSKMVNTHFGNMGGEHFCEFVFEYLG
ncbi:hypothetical protein [Pleionea sp. CnH1-48]|uniref:hypothetical protein n=1 Tax=Pleionea sp. CnH1-48 TaxID=2954494 RepID=UPI0020981652|nr:hypothetical protein [Pleionea sp. CnH1-48]MCO7226355.1 hypothetical protein [Pleionea sp. CnH1-48]